jgi:hypothetical protein
LLNIGFQERRDLGETGMQKRIIAIGALILALWPARVARADGLGATGYQILAGLALAVVVGGIAISLAVILGGIWLVRRLRHKDRPRTRAERIMGATAITAAVVAVAIAIGTFTILGR